MSIGEAIAAEALGGRLWFYTNYHCNLACRYCLTESKPDAPRRILREESIIEAADEAVALGFTAFGVTGGEPFMLPAMPRILRYLATRLPTVVLTNGTLFTERLHRRVAAARRAFARAYRCRSIRRTPIRTTACARREITRASWRRYRSFVLPACGFASDRRSKKRNHPNSSGCAGSIGRSAFPMKITL